MAPNKLQMTANSPRRLSLSETLSNATARYRHWLMAAIAAGSLNVMACSGDNTNANNNGDDTTETTGTESDGGMSDSMTDGGETDGSETDGGETDGGTGDETGGMTDECYLVDAAGDCEDLYICDAIMAQDLEEGQMGTFEADLDALDASGTDARLRLHVDSPDVIQGTDNVAVFRYAQASEAGFTPGSQETQLSTFDGLSAVLVDRNDPFKNDCSVKEVDLGDSVRIDVTNAFGTVYHEKDGELEQAGENGFDVEITAEGTEITTGSFSNFFMVDTAPEVNGNMPTAMKKLNGKIQVTLNTDQFLDENHPLTEEMTRLMIGSEELVPIGGNVWETANAMPGQTGTIDLTVVGANGVVQEHEDDQFTIAALTLDEETEDLCDGVVCDDGNDCTTDSCDPMDGQCDFDPAPNVGNACIDGDDQTINDQCQPNGDCEGEQVDCIDDNQCDDDNACNGEETCNLGTNTCENGTPIDYDDGDACNGVETCDPSDGSLIPGTPIDHDDGDACNGLETCDPQDGSLIPGDPIDHDDGDACNGLETCDPQDGSLIPGTPIDHDDGLVCNGAEGCDPSDGSLIPGTDIDCGNNGTCEEPAGTCGCDEGYAGAMCDTCDVGYEGYPNCTPDVTPPNPPVITTNGGADWAVNQADFTLDGTTDADTHEMWYQIDGGAWNLVNGYNSFNTDWSYDGNIPNNFESHDYCFRAEDEADNQSGVDCIEVIRLP